jgi:hypothetical protein
VMFMKPIIREPVLWAKFKVLNVRSKRGSGRATCA